MSPGSEGPMLIAAVGLPSILSGLTVAIIAGASRLERRRRVGLLWLGGGLFLIGIAACVIAGLYLIPAYVTVPR